MIVSKFGGTSLATASQFLKVIDIIKADPRRQYVVVSAPGKRTREDQKITDLFYLWHRQRELRLSTDEVRRIISARYTEIIAGLGVSINFAGEFEEINRKIEAGASVDYAASRGEYLSGKIMASALGFEFVDPAGFIILDEQGHCQKVNGKVLLGKTAVIPGFYGALPNGLIKTFSRGGSDITGAIVARAIGALLYENWTDVPGLLMADPRVVANPRRLVVVTYRELRELAYMGASVLHPEAVLPVQEAGITINIRNTNDPADEGTRIVAEDSQRQTAGGIVGIAGRQGFTVIRVEKAMMNEQVGFARRALTVLEANGVSFEHMPGGIDTLSIIVDSRQLQGKLERVLSEIKEECAPEAVEARPDLAMIAVVGRAMIHSPGVAAKILSAVAARNINVLMINQGASEISIIIGVKNSDYESAVQAIYEAFLK